MESFSFPQFSPEHSIVYAALYANVTNAATLRKRIVDAAVSGGESEREAVNFAFIDARLVGHALCSINIRCSYGCVVSDYESAAFADGDISSHAG